VQFNSYNPIAIMIFAKFLQLSSTSTSSEKGLLSDPGLKIATDSLGYPDILT
jgi:hypothetical protein